MRRKLAAKNLLEDSNNKSVCTVKTSYNKSIAVIELGLAIQPWKFVNLYLGLVIHFSGFDRFRS